MVHLCIGTIAPASKKLFSLASSTYPSVSVNDVKSPDVFVGTGAALMKPFVLQDILTGMKHVRFDGQVTFSVNTANSD